LGSGERFLCQPALTDRLAIQQDHALNTTNFGLRQVGQDTHQLCQAA
jgi:hypothetical protein